MTQHLTTGSSSVKTFLPFWSRADQTFFSPGRINLIGEHTDYNGGHVFQLLFPRNLWCSSQA